MVEDGPHYRGILTGTKSTIFDSTVTVRYYANIWQCVASQTETKTTEWLVEAMIVKLIKYGMYAESDINSNFSKL